MKCFVSILIVIIASLALASAKPLEGESTEAADLEPGTENAARDKRTLLLGAAPIAYSGYAAYTAPIAYSSPYAYPYAYPYVAPYSAYAYSAPYYWG